MVCQGCLWRHSWQEVVTITPLYAWMPRRLFDSNEAMTTPQRVARTHLTKRRVAYLGHSGIPVVAGLAQAIG